MVIGQEIVTMERRKSHHVERFGARDDFVAVISFLDGERSHILYAMKKVNENVLPD